MEKPSTLMSSSVTTKIRQGWKLGQIMKDHKQSGFKTISAKGKDSHWKKS